MTKLSDLKRGLKSADKRRKRRNQASFDSKSKPHTQQKPTMDAVGLIVQQVLQIAATDNAVDDRSFVTALRCISQQSRTTRTATVQILDAIQTKADEHSVPPNQLRRAANELLAIADSYDTRSSSNPFLRYLELIAS